MDFIYLLTMKTINKLIN